MAFANSLWTVLAVLVLWVCPLGKSDILNITTAPDDVVMPNCKYEIAWSGGDGSDVYLGITYNEGVPFLTLYQGNPGDRDYVWTVPNPWRLGSGYRVYINDSGGWDESGPFDADNVITCSYKQRPTSTSSLQSSTSTTVSLSTTTSPARTTSSTSVSPASTSAVVVPPSQTGQPDKVISCRDVDPRVPADWKCNRASHCITVDNGSTAVCCTIASQANCTNIEPIDCDIRSLNIAIVPNTSIFTTLLNGNLPTCGGDCCPFGYSCLSGNGVSLPEYYCSMIVDSSSINKTAAELASSSSGSIPGAASTSNGTMASTTSFVSPTAIATLASGDPTSTNSTANDRATSTSNDLGTGTLAGIVVGSVAAFVLIAIAAIIIVRRRQTPNEGQAEDSLKQPYEYNPVKTDEAPMSPSTREEDVIKEILPRFEKDGQPVPSPIIHEMA